MDGWLMLLTPSQPSSFGFYSTSPQLCVVRLNKYDYIVRHFTIMIVVVGRGGDDRRHHHPAFLGHIREDLSLSVTHLGAFVCRAGRNTVLCRPHQTHKERGARVERVDPKYTTPSCRGIRLLCLAVFLSICIPPWWWGRRSKDGGPRTGIRRRRLL